MIKYILSSLMCLMLVAFHVSICPAFLATETSPPASAGASSKTSKTTSVKSERQKVVNIVMDKMDSDYIYSDNGQKYKIRSSTKIIKNIQGSSKTRIAELTFESGDLIMIVIK